MTLEPGIHYIVTKGSDDGTLEVGDHIWLEDNLVHCREGQGWLTLADTEEAMRGVEVTVDSNWLATCAHMTQDQQAQALDLLRSAVMFMQFTGEFDRSLFPEEQEWLSKATTFLTRVKVVFQTAVKGVE